MSDASSGGKQHLAGPIAASEATKIQASEEKELKLRHEFVGMMFAVAIGEVGLQTATLVRAHNWIHFLPAYSHLFLATVIIATSWVGWSLSHSRGGQKDVQSVFESEFVVLLLDALLVVIYFIIVRAVDVNVISEDNIRLNASAQPEAFWILVIFWIYLVWDIPTKWPLTKPENGVRVLATAFCLTLAYVIKKSVESADPAHVLTADLALLSLVLLFRALKDLASAYYPSEPLSGPEQRKMKKRARIATLFCSAGIVLGLLWTCYWPLPQCLVRQIEDIPQAGVVGR